MWLGIRTNASQQFTYTYIRKDRVPISGGKYRWVGTEYHYMPAFKTPLGTRTVYTSKGNISMEMSELIVSSSFFSDFHPRTDDFVYDGAVYYRIVSVTNLSHVKGAKIYHFKIKRDELDFRVEH